jgi:hypothetical protein
MHLFAKGIHFASFYDFSIEFGNFPQRGIFIVDFINYNSPNYTYLLCN